MQQGVMVSSAIDVFQAKHPRLTKNFFRFKSVFLETGKVYPEYRRIANLYEKEERALMRNPDLALTANLCTNAPISKNQERKLRSAAFLDARQSPRKTLFDDIRLEASFVAALTSVPAAVMMMLTINQPLMWYFAGTVSLASALTVVTVLITESLEKKLNRKDEFVFQAACRGNRLGD